jgi:hypothetical protein
VRRQNSGLPQVRAAQIQGERKVRVKYELPECITVGEIDSFQIGEMRCGCSDSSRLRRTGSGRNGSGRNGSGRNGTKAGITSSLSSITSSATNTS